MIITGLMESIALSAMPQHSIKTKAFPVNTIGWIAWPTSCKHETLKIWLPLLPFLLGRQLRNFARNLVTQDNLQWAYGSQQKWNQNILLKFQIISLQNLCEVMAHFLTDMKHCIIQDNSYNSEDEIYWIGIQNSWCSCTFIGYLLMQFWHYLPHSDHHHLRSWIRSYPYQS